MNPPPVMSPANLKDLEKVPPDVEVVSQRASEDVPTARRQSKLTSCVARALAVVSQWGFESSGIDPVPPEDRTDTRLYQMFTVWFSCNMSILACGTGSAGPAFYGLGLRTTYITLLATDSISCVVPASFAVFGPKLGMRSMVQARYSWGYYLSRLPGVLNVVTMQGFLILSCIIGGQMLASISNHVSQTIGIVIIAVISVVITLFGYKAIHLCESIAWIPSVIIFVILLAVGGRHLRDAPAPGPVPASAVITFATTVASSVISWCTMTPDYGVYHTPHASSTRLFIYAYCGFFFACVISHMVGSALAASAMQYAPWQAGSNRSTNFGGLVHAVLTPLGHFGDFLMVVLALTIASVCAPSMYTFASSAMTISPYSARVPRFVFVLLSTGILIPVAIVGAAHFYSTVTDVLNIIGYWTTVFAAIVLTEHIVFRGCSFERYAPADWNQPHRLPSGVPALLAFLGAFGLVIPCMNQAWYVGPIARAGLGDVGILVGFVLAAALYSAFRVAEKKLRGPGSTY